MKMKQIAAALLIWALLLALPAGAMAAKKAGIRFPAKVALVMEGVSAPLKPKLKGVKLAEIGWASSDETVLRMTGNTAEALKPGRAVITATGGGATAKVGVVVLPTSVTLAAGEQYSLPRGGVEQYRVKDAAVAKVSGQGVLLGGQPGETRLLVRYGKQRKVIHVVVTGTDWPQAGSAAAALDCAATAEQIVLVEHTGGSNAELSVHEKRNGLWTELYRGAACVGRNGIGKTVEGDAKTPVGTFNLTTPFGIRDDPGAPQPYTKVTKYHYWCGDSSSSYYNRLVDERQADRRHTAADEHLIDYRGLYNYCLFIDYNAEGVPHKGSCIFLHCTGSARSTGGCVAVPEAVMKKIVCWARTGAKIVIRGK